MAGVAIATLTGDNGLLTKAVDAKGKTERAEIIENAKIDVMAIQADNEGSLTKKEFKENVLDKYFKDVPETENIPEDLSTLELKTKIQYGDYTIKGNEIYEGKFIKKMVSFYLPGWTTSMTGWPTPNAPREYFEVEPGTTWREFFSIYDPKNSNGYLYDEGEGCVVHYTYEFGSNVDVSPLLDPEGNNVYVDKQIVDR